MRKMSCVPISLPMSHTGQRSSSPIFHWGALKFYALKKGVLAEKSLRKTGPENITYLSRYVFMSSCHLSLLGHCLEVDTYQQVRAQAA